MVVGIISINIRGSSSSSSGGGGNSITVSVVTEHM